MAGATSIHDNIVEKHYTEVCSNPSNQRLNDLFNHNGVSLKSKKKSSLTSSASPLFFNVTLKWNEKPFGYGLLAWIAYMRHIYECKSVKEKETFEYDS